MKKKSVLIVEDSPTARMQLSEVLTNNGYFIQTAENGQDALEKMKGSFYPVVITDLEMPVMNGYDLIDNFNEMKDQPFVIVITVNDKLETIVDIMKKGVFDYTVKPLTSNDLLIKVDRAFLAYERAKIRRIKEKEKTVGTIFRNLQRSFNQGAGMGTHMTLIQMIIDNIIEEDGKYSIEKTIFDEIKKNQEMVKKALVGLSEMERIMFQDIELELTDCSDLLQLINEVINNLQGKMEIDGHKIVIKNEPQNLNSYPIDINKQYLIKALDEIFINAMKFSKHNSEIEIDFQIDEYSIIINVINTPETSMDIVGIPMEYEESIFEPFFRMENYINEKYETSELGLGLLVVKKIINEHEGDVEISNIEGENSGEVKVKCMITLPIYKQVTDNSVNQ